MFGRLTATSLQSTPYLAHTVVFRFILHVELNLLGLANKCTYTQKEVGNLYRKLAGRFCDLLIRRRRDRDHGSLPARGAI